MRSTTELLAGVPLFRELGPEGLERLAAAAQVRSYAPGERIVEIGEPGRSLFIVTDGIVQVMYPARHADFELARLGPGEFFGEMALLNDKPRSATVRAVGAVETLVLDKKDFRELVLERPAVGLEILESMSIRIRNADEQISGLSDQSVRDPLTGLLNRRAFNERLVEEVERARRYGGEFSLILVDLDHFKSINDTLGFESGDRMLAWIGRLLSEHTRAVDVAFRIGGEEFAILCPNTPAPVARAAAQRLVDVVGEAKPPVDRDIRITTSASYATCPDHAETGEALYRIALAAMEMAKVEGRDRVKEPTEYPPAASGEG